MKKLILILITVLTISCRDSSGDRGGIVDEQEDHKNMETIEPDTAKELVDSDTVSTIRRDSTQ